MPPTAGGAGSGGTGSFKGGGMTAARAAAAAPDPRAEALRCPRCDSANTKFCYYNNYSLAQPRHFCKACKRYWTRGGTLRNVPVGGGCRKNKRSRKLGGSHVVGQQSAGVAAVSSSSSAAAATSLSLPTSFPLLNPVGLESSSSLTHLFFHSDVGGGGGGFVPSTMPSVFDLPQHGGYGQLQLKLDDYTSALFPSSSSSLPVTTPPPATAIGLDDMSAAPKMDGDHWKLHSWHDHPPCDFAAPTIAGAASSSANLNGSMAAHWSAGGGGGGSTATTVSGAGSTWADLIANYGSSVAPLF